MKFLKFIWWTHWKATIGTQCHPQFLKHSYCMVTLSCGTNWRDQIHSQSERSNPGFQPRIPTPDSNTQKKKIKVPQIFPRLIFDNVTKKIWINFFFDRNFFIDSDFFPTNCHTHKIFKIFITEFFREKKSWNRSKNFSRKGWWYSQVPNRPREKDIDDFRFLSPVPTHGSQPMGMGPSPWVPTLGSQPGAPWLSQPGLNADNSRAPIRGGVYPPRSDG